MTRGPSAFTAEPHPDQNAGAYSFMPDAPLRVLKFGSSVLQTIADLPRVVGEIYRQKRAGVRMIVIVSALAGETDELFALSRQVGGGNTDGVAELVSLGEEKTAALLKIACARVGLDALVLRPEELCIHTSGARLEADPDFINIPALARLASRHDLLIMPGFVGIDEHGARSLLGRGGSDFTAIFIGGEMDAECVRLYKDVDGVFDHDPASDDTEALKFYEVSWTDCLEVARPLLQPRSVEYAQAKQLRLEVESIGSDTPTIVGPITRPPVRVTEPRRLRVAMAGFGAVGQAVLARLRSEPRFKLVSILMKDANKPRGASAPALLTTSLEHFLETEADILVEATSDPAAAKDLCHLFLANGRHVVTANKRLIADYLPDLETAGTGGARLLYSAAVGGGTPVLETIRLARQQGRISEILAVLSGTMNLVLERLAAGAALEEVLAHARRAGLAEANPAEDLSGRDVAAKLRIVAAESFGSMGRLDLSITPMDVELAERIATSGERWLQLATLTSADNWVKGRVDFVPAWLAPDIPVLRGEQNHVTVRLDDGRTWLVSGRGAGGLPTGEAILADLYGLCKVLCAGPLVLPASSPGATFRPPQP